MRFGLGTAIMMMLAASICLGGSAMGHRRPLHATYGSNPSDGIVDYGWPLEFAVTNTLEGKTRTGFDYEALIGDIAVAVFITVMTGISCEWWLRRRFLSARSSLAALATGLILFAVSFCICTHVWEGPNVQVDRTDHGIPLTNYEEYFRGCREFHFMGVSGNLAFWCIAALALWAGASAVLRRFRQSNGH
ncbi:MAG: hypothetical protein ABSE73_20730 [Planctomycetota bacterium]